jgi:hypothetical protein
MNDYEWADCSINSCPRCATGFTQLLASSPYLISPVVWDLYESRLSLIRTFQRAALNLFRTALNNETHPSLIHWLLNETPDSLGFRYHRSLEDRHYTLPVFFRTDEIAPGRIVEIQCPGSLWGDLQLTFDYVTRLDHQGGGVSPAAQFATQLTDLLRGAPIVHHLLDNASGPAGMRYFIEKTRPIVKYWGIDYGIWPENCNFIRSHSFFGLCADNEFRSRLVRVGNGVTYDLPPHVLFDQKASLVLPFWSRTRELFSDEIRDLFVFTTPLLPSGIELPDGTHVTIEEFARLARSQRLYYLKYAGSDVALNWGSKAVFRLSNMSHDDCRKLLQECVARYERGQTWLIQKEETHDDKIVFLARDGTTHTEKLRAKLSGFYGPFGCIGVLAMHRHHYKVHGQADTILSYVLVDSKDGDTTLDGA